MTAIVPADRGTPRRVPERQGRGRGNHLVHLAGDHEQPLSREPAGVGQRIVRIGEDLQILDRPAGCFPGLAELPGFGHFPEDSRQVAAGQEKDAVPGGRIHRDGNRSDDPPQADPGHPQPRRFHVAPAGQPADAAPDVANPLTHGGHRSLDVRREKPHRHRPGTSTGSSFTIVGELQEEGRHASICQPGRNVAR